MSPVARTQRGFTLLELLVAVALLAVIGTMALQGLTRVAEQTRMLDEEREAYRTLYLAISLIEADLRSAVPRTGRDELGDLEPALRGTPADFVFTRGGLWSAKGSEMARVSYQWREGQLLRVRWPVLDRTQGTTPQIQELLADVNRFEAEYLGEGSRWDRSWPPPNAVTQGTQPWPRAVRITFHTDQYGRIERLFALPEMPSPAPLR